MTAPSDDPRTALPVATPDWALFLDIDGTLLDLAPTPDRVTVPSGLPQIVGEVARALEGALALVSGRPVSWIDRVFAPLRLAAAGQHGAELRLVSDGPVLGTVEAGDLASIGRRVAAAAAAWPGVVLEDKGFSLAVHYRQAPDRAADVRRLLEAAAADAGGHFHLLSGKMVLELKPAASSKGRAVSALMEVPPFSGRMPVFVGDDRTDEAGFREVLARGGIAVQVGPTDSTLASHHLADPASLRDWLRTVPAAVRRGAA